jgi:hypothetical protein
VCDGGGEEEPRHERARHGQKAMEQYRRGGPTTLLRFALFSFALLLISLSPATCYHHHHHHPGSQSIKRRPRAPNSPCFPTSSTPLMPYTPIDPIALQDPLSPHYPQSHTQDKPRPPDPRHTHTHTHTRHPPPPQNNFMPRRCHSPPCGAWRPRARPPP